MLSLTMTAQNSVKVGGKGGRCALSPAQEREVVEMIGKKPMTEIAELYGVHRNTITNIKSRHRGDAPAIPSTDPGATDKTADAIPPIVHEAEA